MGRHGYGTFDRRKKQWKVRSKYFSLAATVGQLERHFGLPIPPTKRGSKAFWIKFLFSHFRKPTQHLNLLQEEIHKYYESFEQRGRKRQDILRYLGLFQEIAGNIPISEINVAHYRRFFKALQELGYSPITIRNARFLINGFLKTMASNFGLTFPFLHSPEFSFSANPRADITYYSQEQLNLCLRETRDFARIVFLFGINCGFYPSDIASIRPEHVHRGRLIKGRAKNMRYGVQHGAIGNWKLWPETQEMLPLLWEKKPSLFALRAAYLRFASEHNVPPSKYLRKTGAYLLQLHFGEEVSKLLYRAEATGIHYSSYVKLDEAHFAKLDAGLDWLRDYVMGKVKD